MTHGDLARSAREAGIARANSNGKFCVMGDSDDSYDFSNLDLFVKELRAGADVVMGNRFLGGIEPGAMPSKNRYVGNPILSGLGRFLFAAPAQDFHCGLRGFSRRRLSAYGFANDRHGVRVGNGDQGNLAENEDR